MTERGQPEVREPAELLRGPAPSAVHASRAAALRRAVRNVLLCVGAAGLLSLSGAFGTEPLPPGVRLLYWLLLMGCGAGIGLPVSEAFLRRGWADGPLWRVVPLLTLAISAPLHVVIWVASALFFGHAPRLADFSDPLVAVLAISATMTVLNLLLGREPVVTHAPATPPSAPAGPAEGPAPVRFLERLPPKLRGAALHAVESEDHYLRLHTSRGSDLILLRLADALAELEGLEGAQTHRSWWVAREAVRDVRRGDGRATLVLPGGVEAPVSRTYAPALRAAGWF